MNSGTGSTQRKFSLAGSLLALLALVPFQDSLAREVTARGISEIESGQLVNARKLALENAKRAAVEQVVGTFIRARTDVNNFVLVRDQVFSSTSGKISEYAVVKDGVTDQGIYEIVITADVAVNEILDIATEVQNAYGWSRRPRFAVSIDEQTNDLPIGEHARAILTERLLRDGFELFDDSEDVYAGFVLNALVTTESQSSAYQGLDIQSNELVLNLSVRRVGDNQVLASAVASANKPGVNRNTTLTRLADTLVKDAWPDVRRQTLAFWQREQAQARSVMFEIEGVSDMGVASRLAKSLQDAVPAIQALEIPSVEAGKAVFLVTYKGWAEQMYEELIASQFDSKAQLNLTGVKGNKILASLD